MSHFSTSNDAAIWDIHMADSVISDPIEIQNAVQALGLDREGLIECVRYAEHERAFVTANDATGFDSYVMYDKAGRALRERYLPLGVWIRDDSNNQCAIKNPVTKVRVVPCNFDEHAGNILVRPSNKSPKGEVSRKKSACNRTAWLPGVPDVEPARDEDGYQTWLLGMYAADGETTTAELSLPIAFDGKFFTDFGPRIMLITGHEDDETGTRKTDDGAGDGRVEVVDITIRRK
jgi:hypothetical protein